ncbi:MAG: hypothetical protein JWP89_2738 [Schlesneria sp.]|nr:hypothetical protein [Schlesneria sp.]
MTTELSSPVDGYVQATNRHDPKAFIGLFADDALVDDAGREFHGLAAIKAWSDSDIFDAHVTFEVLQAVNNGKDTILTTKVDGTFDRTGLPDPLILSHQITIEGGKIVRLVCRLPAG